MARPRKKIDKKEFEALCAIQCTEEEICAVLDITDKTLANWCEMTYHKRFSEVFADKRRVGHVSLRRTQWNMAKTYAPMAMFLGKNYLGQSDKPQDDQTEVLNKLDEVLNSVKADADQQT